MRETSDKRTMQNIADQEVCSKKRKLDLDWNSEAENKIEKQKFKTNFSPISGTPEPVLLPRSPKKTIPDLQRSPISPIYSDDSERTKSSSVDRDEKDSGFADDTGKREEFGSSERQNKLSQEPDRNLEKRRKEAVSPWLKGSCDLENTALDLSVKNKPVVRRRSQDEISVGDYQDSRKRSFANSSPPSYPRPTMDDMIKAVASKSMYSQEHLRELLFRSAKLKDDMRAVSSLEFFYYFKWKVFFLMSFYRYNALCFTD